MGFPTGDIQSEEGFYSEFVCCICMQLVDPTTPLLTACHHVFCGECLRRWLKTKPSCPTCKRELGSREVGELKTSSPLSWRVPVLSDDLAGTFCVDRQYLVAEKQATPLVF